MSISLDRREFLKKSALAASAATVGIASSRHAHASVPVGHFVVNDPAVSLWDDPVPLCETALWQGFCFDNLYSRIFYAKQRGPAGAVEETAGNIRVAYLHYDGTRNGGHYIDLLGFGHGQGIGYEKYNNQSILWIECDVPAGTGPRTGTKICYVPWIEGETHTYNSSDVGTSAIPNSRKFTLVAGSTTNNPSICPVSNRLMLRFKWPGGTWRGLPRDPGTYYNTYNLSDIHTYGDNATPIYAFTAEPPVPINKDSSIKDHPVQGQTIYGNYGYMISGYRWNSCNSVPKDNGNTYLTCFNLSTGAYSSSLLTADLTRNYREPEGLAVQVVNSAPRLHFSFAFTDSCSSTTGSADPKLMKCFYKDSLINDGL